MKTPKKNIRNALRWKSKVCRKCHLRFKVSHKSAWFNRKYLCSDCRDTVPSYVGEARVRGKSALTRYIGKGLTQCSLREGIWWARQDKKPDVVMAFVSLMADYNLKMDTIVKWNIVRNKLFLSFQTSGYNIKVASAYLENNYDN